MPISPIVRCIIKCDPTLWYWSLCCECVLYCALWISRLLL